MKKINLIILVLLVLIVSGCGAKQTVLVDGMPLPETNYVSRDIESGVRIEAHVARFIWEKEEDKEKGKEHLYPADYLEINADEVQTLPKDTVYVGGTFRIVNPERSYYFLKVEYLFKDDGGDCRKVSRIIYHGDRRDEVFDVGKEINKPSSGITCLRVIFYPESIDSDGVEMETCYKF